MKDQILHAIRDASLDYIVTVPNSEFGDSLGPLSSSQAILYPTREDDGLGMLLGLALAGRRTLGIMQDSGMAESMNLMPLLGLARSASFSIWLGARIGAAMQANPLHDYVTSRLKVIASRAIFEVREVDVADCDQQHLLRLLRWSLEFRPNAKSCLIWYFG